VIAHTRVVRYKKEWLDLFRAPVTAKRCAE
jgi:hypothetical protein